jgi:hypothetical protein
MTGVRIYDPADSISYRHTADPVRQYVLSYRRDDTRDVPPRP